ncbi:RNA polymerase sigma factor [Planctomycetota bacterium]
MCSQKREIDLRIIKQAQGGHAESLSILTHGVTDTVRVYIYRLTLNQDLADDLTPDTMLYLLKRLSGLNLDQLTGFWAWTYRTALSMVQHHYRRENRQQTTSLSDLDQDVASSDRAAYVQGVPERLMSKEKIAAVFLAMSDLTFDHRHVIVLRCLHEMNYGEIATIRGTELRVRLLFLRAKKSLKRRLTDRQFDKKHLLTALGTFGLVTAGSRKTAHAASAAVAAESLSAGGVAATLYAITTVSGLIATALVATTLVCTAVHTLSPPEPIVFQDVTSLAQLPVQSNLAQGSWQPRTQLFSYVSRVTQTDDQRWYSFDPSKPRIPPVVTDPNQFFAKPRRDSRVLLFNQDRALNFSFNKPLRNGRGIDIYVHCHAAPMSLPAFYLVGDSGETAALAPSAFQDLGKWGGMLGIDLNIESLTFVPRSLRIVGRGPAAPNPCFGVSRIRARVE